MIFKIKTLIIVVFLSLTGCIPINKTYKFEYQTIVTEIPINLDLLNTPFDDYNSDLPYPAARMHICFSTSRNKQGTDFDIIYKNIELWNSFCGQILIQD